MYNCIIHAVSVLGMEPRAWGRLPRPSTTEVLLQQSNSFFSFKDGLTVLSRLILKA